MCTYTFGVYYATDDVNIPGSGTKVVKFIVRRRIRRARERERAIECDRERVIESERAREIERGESEREREIQNVERLRAHAYVCQYQYNMRTRVANLNR